MRKLLMLNILLIAIWAAISFAQPSKTMPAVNYPLPTGDVKIINDQCYPFVPDAVADTQCVLGYTYNDMQTFGSGGNRIALGGDNSLYCCWTNLVGWPYPPAPVNVYCSYRGFDNNWYPGFQVNQTGRASNPSMDLIYDNSGIIAYQIWSIPDPTRHIEIAIMPNPPHQGSIQYFYPPCNPSGCYQPRIAVDRNDNIHLVSHEVSDARIVRNMYTRSEDGGHTWIDPELIDTCMVISASIDASPVSDRVVIAYTGSQDTTTQWHNDIMYIVSDDGINWDWQNNQVNITDYANDNDSLWAYVDLDIIFDYNDFFHLVWNAQWVTNDGIYYRTNLFHYNEESDEINEICYYPDSFWYDISGAWNRPMCKLNLGCSEDLNTIITTWTQFDTLDIAAGGFGNGDIYMARSFDGGSVWSDPENITNTHTPGCFPGLCDSEIGVSLTDHVDDYLNMIYINDKDAGNGENNEGMATENEVIYHEDLLLQVNIGNEVNKPDKFALHQNYPNPFNASTTISFELPEASPVLLEIYDITGAKVTTLLDSYLSANRYEIIWDAENISSGVYFYKLKTQNETQTQKAVIIK